MKAWSVSIGISLSAGLVALVFWRAGMTRSFVEDLEDMRAGRTPRTIELRVWDWWSPSANEEHRTYFAEVERTFEERNPNVDVVYQFVPFDYYVQKLSTAMAGRGPPDVFQSSVYWAEGFYQRGMLLPLNDLLTHDGSDSPPERIAKEAFLPSAWRHSQTLGGVVFGIPQIVDASCLLWNLDILEQAAAKDDDIRSMFARNPDGSIDYDRLRFDAVQNWEHFRRILKTLTAYAADGSVAEAGFVIQSYGASGGMFEPWLASNGTSYQDPGGDKALFATPNGVQAIEFLAKLYWEDRVCTPFRRQLSGGEEFMGRRVAVMMAGTWNGKGIQRATQGWMHFGKTAFPPGPMGQGQKTVTWGNMLVIPRGCRNVDAAWRYIKFVCSLEGNLLRLKHLGHNGPRLDFYRTSEWQRAKAERPYLSNVKQICLAGQKLRHTEIIAVDHQASPIFETILLRYPEIAAGRGPYASVAAALQVAATNVDRVYARYNRQVAQWMAKGRGKVTER